MSSRTVRHVHENERIVCSVVFEAQLNSDSTRSEHTCTFATKLLVASKATVSELLKLLPLRRTAQRWAVRGQAERRDPVFHRSLSWSHTWKSDTGQTRALCGLTNHPEEEERRVGDLREAACPDLTHCLMWRLL